MTTPELFHVRYAEPLAELFDELQIKADPTDVAASTAATQPWVRGDHHLPGNRVAVDAAQSDRLYDIYARSGLTGAVELPSGHYDELWVLGGIHIGNYRRMRMIRNLIDGEYGEQPQVTTDSISLWGGERYLMDAERIGVGEGIDSLAYLKEVDPWVKLVAQNPELVTHETHSLRLSMVHSFGNLLLTGADVDPYKDAQPDVQVFSLNTIPVKLLHAPAIHRPHGQARHTTVSSVKNQLQIAPPEQYARVGLFISNPHIFRIAREVLMTLAEEGREDISLAAAGTDPVPGAVHKTFLGEYGRNLYLDKYLLEV